MRWLDVLATMMGLVAGVFSTEDFVVFCGDSVWNIFGFCGNSSSNPCMVFLLSISNRHALTLARSAIIWAVRQNGSRDCIGPYGGCDFGTRMFRQPTRCLSASLAASENALCSRR